MNKSIIIKIICILSILLIIIYFVYKHIEEKNRLPFNACSSAYACHCNGEYCDCKYCKEFDSDNNCKELITIKCRNRNYKEEYTEE